MEITRNVFRILKSEMVTDYAKKFPLGWSFLGPAEDQKWYGTQNYIPEGLWILLHMSWSPTSKTADIKSSGLPVHWIEDS